MSPSYFRNRAHRELVALFVVTATALVAHAQSCPKPLPRCVADLKCWSPVELGDLFLRSDLGNIPVGDLDGQMLFLTDRNGEFRVWASNLVWRGKYFGTDTYFANRWFCNQRRIGSHYKIGPSWTDGKPAIVLEYPPGTPLFENMHDELREVAPGIYLGVVFDRCPCPKFRGFFAVQVRCCQTAGCCKQ